MSVEDLYPDVLLDHFQHPRCQAPIAQPSAKIAARNPLCGDRIELSIAVNDGRVSQVSFSGSGCCISQAAVSIMSELCEGKTVDEVRQLTARYRELLRSDRPPAEFPELGEACALEGVRKFTARIRCALLCCEALERCLNQVSNSEHGSVA